MKNYQKLFYKRYYAQNSEGEYAEVKDNIKLSEPTFDKNELPTYNKAVVYNKDTGATLGTFYLKADNTVTTNAADGLRLLPVQTKYIEYDPDKANTNRFY